MKAFGAALLLLLPAIKCAEFQSKTTDSNEGTNDKEIVRTENEFEPVIIDDDSVTNNNSIIGTEQYDLLSHSSSSNAETGTLRGCPFSGTINPSSEEETRISRGKCPFNHGAVKSEGAEESNKKETPKKSKKETEKKKKGEAGIKSQTDGDAKEKPKKLKKMKNLMSSSSSSSSDSSSDSSSSSSDSSSSDDSSDSLSGSGPSDSSRSGSSDSSSSVSSDSSSSSESSDSSDSSDSSSSSSSSSEKKKKSKSEGKSKMSKSEENDIIKKMKKEIPKDHKYKGDITQCPHFQKLMAKKNKNNDEK